MADGGHPQRLALQSPLLASVPLAHHWHLGLGLQYLQGRGSPLLGCQYCLHREEPTEAWTPEAEKDREGWQSLLFHPEILEVGE